ncbi:T9SS type A sorting domain-containing protein [candidate division KSB1 bacterium]|nr:T9SS type A sorting domain-containing protein [candidate division KSB1 bacterium]
MKRHQLALIAIAAIVALLPHSLFAQEPDYFPMKIGNKWFYKHLTNLGNLHWANKTVEITDTTAINGKIFFVFDEKLYDIHYEPGKVHQSKSYYRKLGNGDVVRFSAAINDEQLYYSFLGDSLYRPYFFCLTPRWKWQITLTGYRVAVRNPAGYFPNCFQYDFRYSIDGHLVPETYFIALAPNLGFINEIAEGDWNFLVGAFLNGKVVGDTLLTNVEESSFTLRPSSPILYQNYPNPFRSQTTLFYSLPNTWRELIHVSVFDLLGCEIKTFTPHKALDGQHQFLWNGTDNLGKEVKNGIYIARLRSGPIQQTIKICLTR